MSEKTKENLITTDLIAKQLHENLWIISLKYGNQLLLLLKWDMGMKISYYI